MLTVTNYTQLKPFIEHKKLFIFDFDGTIANTEIYQWEAYNECLKKYGVTLSNEDISRYIGQTEYVIYAMIKKDFDIDYDNEMFFNERIDKYLSLTEQYNLQPFQYFNNLINEYDNVTFVILSSQKEYIIRHLLNRWGIEERFKEIISVGDRNISKIQVLENVEQYFGYSSYDVVLFEDSNSTLSIGMQNKIFTIGIEHSLNKDRIVNCNVLIKGDY